MLGFPNFKSMVQAQQDPSAMRQPPMWGNRDFVVVLISRFVAQFGLSAVIITITLFIQSTSGDRGPVYVAIYLLSASITLMLFAPLAGRLSDTHDSRTLTLIASLVCALSLAGMALAVFLAEAPILWLILFTVTLNAGVAVTLPVWQALLPRIVGEGQKAEAIGALQSALTLSQILGTMFGAWLAGLHNNIAVFSCAALAYLLLAAGSLAVRTRRHVRREQPERSPATLLDGFRLIRSDASIFYLIVGVLAMLLFVQAIDVLEIFLATVSLGATSFQFGLLSVISSIGMILGAYAAGRIRSERLRSRAYMLSLIWIPVTVILAGLSPNLASVFVIFTLLGIGVGILNSTYATLLLERSPEHHRGQISSLSSAGLRAVGVIALGLGGVIGALSDPRTGFVVSGLLALILGGAGALLFARSEHRTTT